MKALLQTIFILFISLHSNSQCATGAAKNCSSASSNTLVGNASWSNPGNASVSDNQFAVATPTTLGDNSNYLVATGFGFVIPSYATICGIKVEIQRRQTGLYGVVTDNSVKIVKNGVILGPDKKMAGVWPTSRAYATYGSSSDLWGTTWTSADLNSSNFGIAISANLSGVNVMPNANIDHIQITIYYSGVLPVELLYFNADCASDKEVNIKWATASQSNNDYFTVERSLDGINFEGINSVKGAGSNTQTLHYSVMDLKFFSGINYYRLKQTDFNGDHQYSNMKEVSCLLNKDEFISYPNPASEQITFKGSGKVYVYNMLGENIYTSDVDKEMEIDLSKYPKGTYSIIFDSAYKRVTEKIILE